MFPFLLLYFSYPHITHVCWLSFINSRYGKSHVYIVYTFQNLPQRVVVQLAWECIVPNLKLLLIRGKLFNKNISNNALFYYYFFFCLVSCIIVEVSTWGCNENVSYWTVIELLHSYVHCNLAAMNMEIVKVNKQRMYENV